MGKNLDIYDEILVITNTIQKPKRMLYSDITHKCQHVTKDKCKTDQQGSIPRGDSEFILCPMLVRRRKLVELCTGIAEVKKFFRPYHRYCLSSVHYC